MEETKTLLEWLKGKKTYLTVGAILACGVLGELGVEIPPYVWAALAAAGLGFLRSAVNEAANGQQAHHDATTSTTENGDGQR